VVLFAHRNLRTNPINHKLIEVLLKGFESATRISNAKANGSAVAIACRGQQPGTDRVQSIIDNQQVFKSQAQSKGASLWWRESGGGWNPAWFRRATPPTHPPKFNGLNWKPGANQKD
jgi:hypothetical protein